jgi:hypothetical protein
LLRNGFVVNLREPVSSQNNDLISVLLNLIHWIVGEIQLAQRVQGLEHRDDIFFEIGNPVSLQYKDFQTLEVVERL